MVTNLENTIGRGHQLNVSKSLKKSLIKNFIFCAVNDEAINVRSFDFDKM